MPSQATNKPSIHERMAAILAGMPAIGKDSYNQGMKFNFRSVDAILNELNPLLEKHGVFIVPRVVECRSEALQPKGRMAIVTVEYRFVADDGNEIVAVSVGEGHDFGDKSVSKAMTMAFKTCLGQTFAIATHEDDPDAGDSMQQASSGAAPAPAATQEERQGAAGSQGTGPAAPTGDEPKWQKVLAIVKQVKSTDAELAKFRNWLEEKKIPNDFAKMTDKQLNEILAELEPF